MANPPSNNTVHIVGGRGDQSGRSIDNGGGYIDGGDAAYLTFQGINGGPISDASAWDGSGTACSVSYPGVAGKIRITRNGAFANCMVGALANISFAGWYNDGIYEIVGVDVNGNWVDVSATWVQVTTCDIKVGGAWAGLQDALDNNATNAADYSRTIYTNLAETLASAIDIDTGGGSVSKNTHKRIVGFNTVPGDMDYGGGYYQSPLDAYINGIDTTKCVEYDANNNAINVFTISVDNVKLQNLYVNNTNAASGSNGIVFGSTPTGVIIRNCRFNDLYYGLTASVNSLSILDSYFGTTTLWAVNILATSSGLALIGNVFNTANYSVFSQSDSMVVAGNIFIGATRAIAISASLGIVFNNTFYLQTENCIRLPDAASRLIEFNNLFVTEAVDDYAVYVMDGKGTVLYSDYSWAYCPAGDFTVEPW